MATTVLFAANAGCSDTAPSAGAPTPQLERIRSALNDVPCANDGSTLTCSFASPAAARYRLYVDADRDRNTGHLTADSIGADFLVEAYATGYTQLYRDGPATGWGWEPLGPIAFSHSGERAQFSIARARLGLTAACGESCDLIFNHDATLTGAVRHVFAPACPGGRAALAGWSVASEGGIVTYELRTTGTPDFFHAWIDADRNRATGYVVDGILGADYLLEANDRGYSRLHRDLPAQGWGWEDVGPASFSSLNGVARWTVPRPALGESACVGAAGADLVFDVQTATIRAASPPVTHTYAGACAEGGDGSVVLVGAGDIASDNFSHNATATLLDQIVAANPSAVVMAVGDLAYLNGSADDFAAYYHPRWGAHKARTRPAVGNHEYVTPGAAGYFGYWGQAAGDPNKGYYSYDHGAWHVVVLNSNCREVGGCEAGTPQERWLRADLAENPSRCTLAYWHHPFVSSGYHHRAASHDTKLVALWQALQEAGVDVAVTGHDHDYERFAPLRADLALDETTGIRSFVVGTANSSQRPFATVKPGSEARSTGVQGLLKLTLRASDYDWAFVAVAGQTYEDRGTAPCRD